MAIADGVFPLALKSIYNVIMVHDIHQS